MKYFYIFIIRAIMSVVIASLISFFFFNGIQIIKTSLLAAVLLAIAYLFEYTKSKEGNE
jgi:maltodextrin utilization protein YvdJ